MAVPKLVCEVSYASGLLDLCVLRAARAVNSLAMMQSWTWSVILASPLRLCSAKARGVQHLTWKPKSSGNFTCL
jgi:hypothetical protein